MKRTIALRAVRGPGAAATARSAQRRSPHRPAGWLLGPLPALVALAAMLAVPAQAAPPRVSGTGFVPPVRYPVGRKPMSVAIGDLNGDHIPDLVVANADRGDVSVLLGRGGGRFRAATTLSTGMGFSIDVALADVNGDGKLDAILVGNDAVSVLLGNGDGTFRHLPGGLLSVPTAALYQNTNTSASPVLAVADVNGDGTPDLIVPEAEFGVVAVLLGTRNGRFQAPMRFVTDPNRYLATPVAVAVRDLNGDGKPDITVVNQGTHTVAVLFGLGGGRFAAPVTYRVGDMPTSVAIADLNGDGRPDLVVSSGTSGDVSVLLNTGQGRFAAARAYPAGTGLTSVAVGDFNGDGEPDLVVADATSTIVTVLHGRGTGAFDQPVPYTVGSGPSSIAVGDLNGDGKPDLVVTTRGDNAVSVLLGTGRATAAICGQLAEVTALAAAPGNVLWAGIYHHGALGSPDRRWVFRSSDGGRCWVPFTTYPKPPTGQDASLPDHIGLLVVPPHHPSWLLAGSSFLQSAGKAPELYRSEDGGRTWTPSVAGLPRGYGGVLPLPVQIAASAAGTLVLAYLHTPFDQTGWHGQGLARSVDDGRAWQPVGPVGMTAQGVVALAGGTLVAVFAAQSGAGTALLTYRSRDDGRTWQRLGTLLPPGAGADADISTLCAAPWDATDLLAGFGVELGSPRIYRSTDAGARWARVWPAARLNDHGIAVYGFAALARTHTLLLTDLATVYRSTDGGATWTYAGTGLPRASSAFEDLLPALAAGSDGVTAYVGGKTGLYRSVDGGRTWQLPPP